MTAIPLPQEHEQAQEQRRRRGVPVRQILCLLPLVLVAIVAVRHRSVLVEGFAHLATAQWPWLVAAVCATCLTWVAAAVTRQGALVERLPALRLLATQFAAGAANHLLPTGLGASAVNLRFMTVCGVSLARSSAALALYLLAESIARVGLLLALLIAFPHALRLGALLPDGAEAADGMATPLLIGVAAVVCVAVVVVLLVRRLRTAVLGFVRTALSEARSVHTRPTRILALWGGSLAFPVLQATGLVMVGLALGLDIPVTHMALAYLAATVAVALIPTPGGLGSVEAALVVALVAAGGPVAVATAVVLAYRIITVWLPLLPGALTLGALVRLKVI
ncbi:lysylphosphatidylglycerol synthase transmembrane domain-containing protein [Streptomyces ipomoeae]|uniref:lysylphosphatidylglycerol synthase transmembrane domain-containing protein n=1 Tax=Streptomyces ipomoeae TaxID=103232 RepID=UPI0029B912D2|nr:lysylphosphatidylglycerol synthase transmembrane domain-containing protein [Streptomyces ipomoeae]MDX2823920.1 lysylphosphatidylglycerol synthase transmembrane domain-containing protein [Streptomyces ipomoeae]MDX2878157.1 lysylphosphatidylglycerol synthase transmembrane domain-containing protein [Streptomyces ipomoeae]